MNYQKPANEKAYIKTKHEIKNYKDVIMKRIPFENNDNSNASLSSEEFDNLVESETHSDIILAMGKVNSDISKSRTKFSVVQNEIKEIEEIIEVNNFPFTYDEYFSYKIFSIFKRLEVAAKNNPSEISHDFLDKLSKFFNGMEYVDEEKCKKIQECIKKYNKKFMEVNKDLKFD